MDNCNEHENKIKEALLKRALGYEYEEKTVEAGPNGKPKSVKVTKNTCRLTRSSQRIYSC